MGSSFLVHGVHWLVAVNIQKDVLSLGLSEAMASPLTSGC